MKKVLFVSVILCLNATSAMAQNAQRHGNPAVQADRAQLKADRAAVRAAREKVLDDKIKMLNDRKAALAANKR